MAKKMTVHMRLPNHVLEAAREQANTAGMSLSAYVRNVMDEASLPDRENVRYVKAKNGAMTFSAEPDVVERATQTANKLGVSLNSFYVQSLAQKTGVLPCHVVVEKER